MCVQSLGQEDPLEEEMATNSSILDGKFHGQRSLAVCNPWGHKELNITEQLNNNNKSSGNMFKLFSPYKKPLLAK